MKRSVMVLVILGMSYCMAACEDSSDDSCSYIGTGSCQSNENSNTAYYACTLDGKEVVEKCAGGCYENNMNAAVCEEPCTNEGETKEDCDHGLTSDSIVLLTCTDGFWRVSDRPVETCSRCDLVDGKAVCLKENSTCQVDSASGKAGEIQGMVMSYGFVNNSEISSHFMSSLVCVKTEVDGVAREVKKICEKGALIPSNLSTYGYECAEACDVAGQTRIKCGEDGILYNQECKAMDYSAIYLQWLKDRVSTFKATSVSPVPDEKAVQYRFDSMYKKYTDEAFPKGNYYVNISAVEGDKSDACLGDKVVLSGTAACTEKEGIGICEGDVVKSCINGKYVYEDCRRNNDGHCTSLNDIAYCTFACGISDNNNAFIHNLACVSNIQVSLYYSCDRNDSHSHSGQPEFCDKGCDEKTGACL